MEKDITPVPVIKKISVASMIGIVKVMIREGKIIDGQDILRVVGEATKYNTGENDYGPWVEFRGTFRAVNLLTGQKNGSGRLFLPEIAGDMLEGVLSDKACTNVAFGFDIGIVFDDKSGPGYIYKATPLIAPEENDPLTMMENKIANMLPSPGGVVKEDKEDKEDIVKDNTAPEKVKDSIPPEKVKDIKPKKTASN